MKTSIYVLVSVFSICAATLTSQAQQLDYALPASNMSSSGESRALPTSSANAVSKATNNFSSSYPNATEVVWSKRDNLSWVSFKASGTPIRAAYNQNGKIDYLITYYYGAKFPSNISNLVKRNGYTQKIILATEITKRNSKTYVVKLEDENNFTSLLMNSDGTAEVQQTVRKS